VSKLLNQIYALSDFEAHARAKLPRQLFSYIFNGADDEQTVKTNRAAFERYAFVPRMLEGVAGRSQEIELFGKKYASPFGISPVGLAAMW
jgi:L-lactate dehydrogenase (cytochrome)